MQVTMTFRHMEASQAIRDHVDNQINHLRKYLIKPTEIHVILSVEKKFRHKCEMVLFEQLFKASADATTEDMYKSIDKAVTKIQKQVLRHKKKVQGHHKHHHSLQEISALAEREYQQKVLKQE